MKSSHIFLASTLAGTIACATPPEPVRYLAATRPKSIPSLASPPPGDGNDRAESISTRFGILYRPPVDVPTMVMRLQREQGSAVLTHGDVRLQTPFCYTLFCIGRDIVSADPQ